MNEYDSVFGICKEYIDWLKEKPRERVLRCVTLEGDYFTLFYSKSNGKTREGIGIMYEDNSLVPLIYPTSAKDCKVIDKYEDLRSYHFARVVGDKNE